MRKFKLDTPILFIVFNRLDTTRRVLKEIRKAKPKKLFISADGPRNTNERKITEKVREYVLDNIDWNCEVKTLFRNENLGCGLAVSKAINWFFKNVGEGIILEDDCLPSQNFFEFCQEMLEKYRGDDKIMHISGDNFINNKFSKDSYYFTKYPLIWGWATWRSAWENYDIESYKKITSEEIRIAVPNLLERSLFTERLDGFKHRGGGSWDIQWAWEIWNQNALCICPKVNLIENIGLSGGYATHTHENYWDKVFLNNSRRAIKFPLKHPKKIKRNLSNDFKMVSNDLLRVFLKKLF